MTGRAAAAKSGSARFDVLLLACVFAALGCGDGSDDASRPALTREQLLDPQTCKDCHPKYFDEWSASMHAYASKDPVFLAMNRRGQEETGGELGAFCVNCHAPLAVREGTIQDYADVESVPEALQGVTCYFCHNATAVEDDHINGHITLANDTTMRAAFRRAQIPSVHRVRHSDLHDHGKLDSSLLCGTCHDVVTPAGVQLERTLTEYLSTVLSHPDLDSFKSCNSCHMDSTPKQQPIALSSGVPGVGTGARNGHEHLFPAVDLPLTPFPKSGALRRAIEDCQLPNSLSSYFVVTLKGRFAPFTVFMETQAGHNQPSGASQDRRMWLEAIGFDQAGDQVYSEGVIEDGQIEETPDRKHPCMLQDHALDASGAEAHMFWDATKRGAEKHLPGPVTAVQGGHTLACDFTPSRVEPLARIEFRLRLRPIGLDILQDLVDSGHLAPEIMAQMPTLTVATRVARLDPIRREYLVDTPPTGDCHTYKCMFDPDGEGNCQGVTGAAGGAP